MSTQGCLSPLYSASKHQFQFSHSKVINNFIAQQLESGEFCIGSTASKSLNMLINYLITSGVPLDSSGTVLRNPVSNVDKWTMKCTDLEMVKKIGTSYTYSGEIFEALHKRTNKRVMTRSYDGTIPESLNAFLLEAEVLKRCNQSNIAR